MSTNSNEKCLNNCAVIKDLNEHIARHTAEIDKLIILSASDDFEPFTEAIIHAMQHLGAEYEPASAEMVMRNPRGTGSQAYVDLTEHIEEIARLRDDLLARCQGPLGMRAVRDGIEYTAKVCTSPIAPLEANLESTEITRREVE